MADIFVSYASTDRERVRSLVESLEMQNWTIWWDREITPGEGFADEIDREIQAANCVVVIWSEASIESRWVKSEALEAMEREVLVPIKLEEVRIPVAFKQIQTVDLMGWPDSVNPEAYPALMKAITALVGNKLDAERPDQDINSICVRPFQLMSRDPAYEFLADGITEDLITALSHLEDFFVMAVETSFNFRDQSLETVQIGEQLGVKYVLEGSVRPMGAKIRVTARLVDTITGSTLLSERFDESADEFYQLQDYLVDGIVSKMGWQLRVSEVERIRQMSVNELDVQALLLKVVTTQALVNREGMNELMGLIDRALEIAPDSARALSMRAQMLGGSTSNMLSDDIEADRTELHMLSERAIKLAPHSATVFVNAGMAHGLSGMYPEAIEYLEQAQSIAPGLPDAFCALGYAYIMSGINPARGVELVGEGIKRDPLHSSVSTRYQWRAMGEATLGRYDDAIASIRKSLRKNPLYPWAWINLAVWLHRTHQEDEARRSIAQARRINPDMNLESIRDSATVASGEKIAASLMRRLEQLWE